MILEVYQAVLDRNDVVFGMVADVQTFGGLVHWQYFALRQDIFIFSDLSFVNCWRVSRSKQNLFNNHFELISWK